MAKQSLTFPKAAMTGVAKAMHTKPAGKVELTPDLYNILPKVGYELPLASVNINGKTTIVTSKNLAAVVKDLNAKHKKTKDITLCFVGVIPLSQEVVVDFFGKRVKTKGLGATMIYDWKARYWNFKMAGYLTLSDEQQKKTDKRFDQGLVKFAKANGLRHVTSEPVPAK